MVSTFKAMVIFTHQHQIELIITTIVIAIGVALIYKKSILNSNKKIQTPNLANHIPKQSKQIQYLPTIQEEACPEPWKCGKLFDNTPIRKKTAKMRLNSKPICQNGPYYTPIIDRFERNKRNNKYKNNNSNNKIRDIQNLQKEIDLNNPVPSYLDGYSNLNNSQKEYLRAIKSGNQSKIESMSKHNRNISSNINFNDSHILRECILSRQLEILKYLKKEFSNEIDLNGNSGYAIRWSARKGDINMINYLLFEQKYQNINIQYFQYQCITWSIQYGHKNIAKILQNYYIKTQLNNQWNILKNNKNLSLNSEDDVDFDVDDLPSIYQEIMDIIINNDKPDDISIIKTYYYDGCYMNFQNNLPWKLAVDCGNINVLDFLHKNCNIKPLVANGYIIRYGCAQQPLNVELIRFAKRIIPWEHWEQYVNVNELNSIMDQLNNTNSHDIPQTPVKVHNDGKYIEGVLTRSARKKLVQQGLLPQL